MIRADLVVRDLAEVATLAVGAVPRIGAQMRELARIPDAAVAVSGDRIAWVGKERALSREVRLRSGGTTVDGSGGTLVPGFVDAHTHVLFAGDRAAELPLRVGGASYAEIARRGGGLYSTVRATRRAASDRELLRVTGARLRRMASNGTTSFEVKSGYSLDHAGELRLLRLDTPPRPQYRSRTRAHVPGGARRASRVPGAGGRLRGRHGPADAARGRSRAACSVLRRLLRARGSSRRASRSGFSGRRPGSGSG